MDERGQSVSSTELDLLKHKVEDTEQLHANLKQSRHECQSMETQLHEVRSSENATKLQLAKDEAERSSTELTAKSDEFAKCRHANHAKLSSLQSAHDALVQTHTWTEGTVRTLQSANTAQSQQLAQALAHVQDLTSRLAEQEATYASEAAGLHCLVEMMEECEAQAKSIVENIENEWAGVGEHAERREAARPAEAEHECKRAESAEDKIEEMEHVLEHMNRGEYAVPLPCAGANSNGSMFETPSMPVRNGANDPVLQGMMMLSPSVAMASHAQKGGKTFTEVYTELIRMQEQYSKKSDECNHLDRTLQSVLAQIECTPAAHTLAGRVVDF
ncbi:hypothetical protein DENSPDRAFT_892679 [Dentipellis sp. KUC8613]|nr:hypothetical protein DENSPDRAFT_892679 [Dentipellis sp. KUC8613]